MKAGTQIDAGWPGCQGDRPMPRKYCAILINGTHAQCAGALDSYLGNLTAHHSMKNHNGEDAWKVRPHVYFTSQYNTV